MHNSLDLSKRFEFMIVKVLGLEVYPQHPSLKTSRRLPYLQRRLLLAAWSVHPSAWLWTQDLERHDDGRKLGASLVS